MLSTMLVPVLMGSSTTIIAIFVLIGSNSSFFDHFMKIIITVCVSGTLHACFFLPLLLVLFGPEREEKNLDEQDFGGGNNAVIELPSETGEKDVYMV